METRDANCHIPVAERARKLRANYNIHAQSLRTRVEIRVNRIPLSLRKVKMGDLLLKYSGEQHLQLQKAAPGSARGPPVPAKDTPKKDTQLLPPRPLTAPSVSPAHSIKRPRYDLFTPGVDVWGNNYKMMLLTSRSVVTSPAETRRTTTSRRRRAPARPARTSHATPARSSRPPRPIRGSRHANGRTQSAPAPTRSQVSPAPYHHP